VGRWLKFSQDTSKRYDGELQQQQQQQQQQKTGG
jgi:hypothetical protein